MKDLTATLSIQNLRSERLNPRDGAKTTLALWCRGTAFGDNINGMSPRDFILSKLGGIIDNTTPLYELELMLKDKYYYEPVYGLNHAGYAFDTHPYVDKWDSGRAGIILISKDTAHKIGINDENASEILRNEVIAYTDFINSPLYGDPYSYLILEFDGREIISKFYYGFLDSDMIDEMRNDCPKSLKKLFNYITVKDRKKDVVVIKKRIKLFKRS